MFKCICMLVIHVLSQKKRCVMFDNYVTNESQWCLLPLSGYEIIYFKHLSVHRVTCETPTSMCWAGMGRFWKILKLVCNALWYKKVLQMHHQENSAFYAKTGNVDGFIFQTDSIFHQQNHLMEKCQIPIFVISHHILNIGFKYAWQWDGNTANDCGELMESILIGSILFSNTAALRIYLDRNTICGWQVLYIHVLLLVSGGVRSLSPPPPWLWWFIPGGFAPFSPLWVKQTGWCLKIMNSC